MPNGKGPPAKREENLFFFKQKQKNNTTIKSERERRLRGDDKRKHTLLRVASKLAVKLGKQQYGKGVKEEEIKLTNKQQQQKATHGDAKREKQ